ncbi:hypothetical protein ACIPSJ_26995 [Streptomyces sp. NPDC090088]|uniref:hypothetical protein n=1 Tax=Streptomyces sp. NPDC090088 TaxID=3365944 RepID=UPI00381C0C76
MVGIASVARAAVRRSGGMWHFLTTRVQARQAVELERVRNEATVVLLSSLQPGIDFYESEPGGRTRLIRVAPGTVLGPVDTDPSQPPTGRINP